MNRASVHQTIVPVFSLLVGFGLTLLADCGAFADDLTDRAAQVTIENSGHFDSLSLFMAAGKAFKEGRTEDAGFLFYAGQFRAGVDLEVFDPVGVGGDSPAVLLGALKATLGPAINPVVMRDREAFSRIAARLAKWTPVFDAGYDPGWEYKVELRGPAREAAIKTLREPLLASIQPLNQLLQDDEFYRSFKIVQDYNLKALDVLPEAPGDGPSKAAPAQVSDAEFTAAMDRLKEIEKARGIKSGLFPDRNDWKKSRKTEYKILADKVTYRGRNIAGADPATFRVFDGEVDYAKDAQHVYVLGHSILGADPTTFKVLDGLYARDKSNIYNGNVVMKVENIGTFELVRASTAWEMDNAEPPNITGGGWARDGKHWYYGPAKIKGVDYDSFRPVDDFYAEDKNQEYTGKYPAKKGSIPAWARRPRQ